MIVAFTGAAGSGKDTAASMLSEFLPGTTTIMGMADLPKIMASNHFNVDVNIFSDRNVKDVKIPEFNLSPRELLVQWWDGLFELHGYDYSLCMNISKIQKITTDNVIITDIRYPIEFDWVKSDNIPLINIKRNVDKVLGNHVTEQQCSIGHIVNNNSTLSNLRLNMKEFIKYA
jgi:hypothetical protein